MVSSIQKNLSFGEVNLVKPSKKGSGAFREAMAKFSRAVMLPVAMLPIAGLALGIGTTINSQSSSAIGQTIGNIIAMPGSIIFAILPLLFGIAIAITFTNDSGTAALSTLLGYCVFSIFQSALIIQPVGTDPNYHFLFYKFNPTMYSAIFTDVIGIQTLSSSIFGGIIVGAIVAYLYTRFRTIQLPKALGFFSGVRFIPIVTFGAMCVVGMLFAMVWPMIGLGLYYLGEGLSYGGKYGGVTSLAYGIFNRALVPFGLHHILNVMLWFTSIGGEINTTDHFYATWGTGAALTGNSALRDTSLTWAQLANAGNDSTNLVTGDINMQIFLTRIIGKNHDHTITVQDLINSYNGLHAQSMGGDNSIFAPGQYTNFAYVFGMFGLPGAALGMLFAAPKGENRKLAATIVVPGAIVSTLTGASEAIEFTFLFLAPWLFWGFHALMAGFAGMITTIFIYYVPSIAPHTTFSFSQGIIDFVIYGALPDIRGGGTHCWVLLIMSLMYFPIYFGIFYWAIKKWNLKTPGRNGATKLFTKADWVKKQRGQSIDKAAGMKDKAFDIIEAYGGRENIKNIDACLTKLRIQVADKNKVQRDRLKELGALGVIDPSPQSVYAVFGQEADVIKITMKDIIAKGEFKQPDPKIEELNKDEGK